MNSNLFSYSNVIEISMRIPVIFQTCLEVNLIFEVTTTEEQKVSRKQDSLDVRCQHHTKKIPILGGVLPKLKN